MSKVPGREVAAPVLKPGGTVSGPITPDEANVGHCIPSVVFDVVNTLLSRGSTVLTQSEVVRLIEASGIRRHDIFDNHYLDFEEAYRAKGWSVVYDKPGFNETYEACWRFSR